MSELNVMNRLFASRFQIAVLLGVGAFVAIAAEWNDLDAAWLSFPLGRRSSDEGTPKSKSSFNATIRKLMKDAKAAEEKGDLDQAIALADQATNVSESTSKFFKTAPELSPAVTSRYARDLRLKKAEQSVKRTGEPAPATTADAEALRPKPKTRVAEMNPPAPKKLAVARAVDKAPEPKEVPKKPRTSEAMASTKPHSPLVPKLEPSQKLVVERESPAKSLVRETAITQTSSTEKSDNELTMMQVHSPSPKKPVTPIPSIDDGWDQDEPVTASTSREASKQSSFETPVASEPDGPVEVTPVDFREQQADVEEWIAAEDQSIFINPGALPKNQRRDEPFHASVSTPLKLRPQYATSIVDDVLGDSQSRTQSKAVKQASSRNCETTEDDDDASISTEVVPTGAEDGGEPTEHSSSKLIAQVSSQKEVVRMRTFDDSEVPFESALDLRNRLQSAASFEPGMVAPGVGESGSDPATDESSQKTRILRLRKRRQTSRILPKPDAAVVESVPTRKSVVSQTSVIQWKPMKSETPTTTHAAKNKPESTVTQPDDLRRSLRGISSMTADVPSASPLSPFVTPPPIDFGDSADTARQSMAKHSGSRPSARDRNPAKSQMQGPVWDHAITPSSAGEAANSWNQKEQHGTSSALAPLPPPDTNVELTSFDSLKELLPPQHDSQQDDSSLSSIAALSGSNDAGHFLKTLERAGFEADEPYTTAETRPRSTSQRVSSMLGVAASTLWTMIGAAGFAMVLAGLWLTRAAIRSKFSSHNE